MKRILMTLMVLCLVLGMAVPAFAAEAESLPDAPIGISDNATPTDAPADPAGDQHEEEIPAPEGSVLPDGESPIGKPQTEEAPPLGESCPAGIAPLSGFEGENNEFFTKVRLTAADRSGNPIAGAVYGLYRRDTGELADTLTTDSFGVAVSMDVPADTDYYLVELSAPEGLVPNGETKEIYLTEVCAPSQVDVSVVYDPITGRIQVNKMDEDGNPLPGAGFYVYRQTPWKLVETLTTGQDGAAITGDLPYGQYELYEYAVPEGYAGSGWEYVFISDHGEIREITVVNHKATGSVRIYKIGNDDRDIGGAVFSIYNADTDEWAQDITTGSDGCAYSGSLHLGDYYAVEKSVPAPYKLDDTRHPFSITYNGQYVYLNIVNEVDGAPGRVKVIKVDGKNNPLSGVTFGLFREWDNKRMETLTSGKDGTAKSALLIPGSYYLVEESGRDGYQMSAERIAVTIDGSDKTVKKTVINPKICIFGKVKVIKQDDVGAPVEGVRFGLYCRKGILLEELVTGSDGTAISGILNEGKGYYLRELEGVPGYLADLKTRYSFDITANQSVVPITVTNPRTLGVMKVVKTGENGEPLPGVAFDIYRAAIEKVSDMTTDEKVGELTTDADGIAEAQLPLGLYYLVETATGEGYLLPEGRVSFALTENGATVEVPIQNQKAPDPVPETGHIRLIKKSEDGKLLPGAVFGIYRTDTGEKVGELVTGSDGTAVSAALPVLEQGFYLQEITAPAGFVLSAQKTAVVVKNGETIEVTVTNKAAEKPVTPDPEPAPGKLLVIKKEEKTGTLLKGAVFGVYRASDDRRMGEITTDRYGEAALGLAAGEYYLRELEAPAGFKPDSGRIPFRIRSGETKELTVTNQRDAETSGTLLLIKKTEGGKLLSGAVFGVYDADTREKLDEITTDRYGEASIKLGVGNYYLRELKAPNGFALSGDKVSFKIESGKTKEITVTNKPLEPDNTGTLLLVKKAAGSGNPLSGAVFEVFALSDNKKVGEITSGTDGTAELSLPAGDFYLLEKTAPVGYKLESARILFRVKADSAVKVEVTNVKEGGGQPVQPAKPNPPTGTPGISIPKTGEAFPAFNYALAGLLFALATLCGFGLWRERGARRHTA